MKSNKNNSSSNNNNHCGKSNFCHRNEDALQSAINFAAAHKSCALDIWTDILDSLGHLYKLKRLRPKEPASVTWWTKRAATAAAPAAQLRDIKQNLKGFAPQNGNGWQLATGNWHWALGERQQSEGASLLEPESFAFSRWVLSSLCISAFSLFDHFSNVWPQQRQVGSQSWPKEGHFCWGKTRNDAVTRHDKLCARLFDNLWCKTAKLIVQMLQIVDELKSSMSVVFKNFLQMITV